MTSYFEEGTVGVQGTNYNEMSLDEACWTAREEIAEICNEARIETLMNEYAYLVENGVEVDYTSSDSFFAEAEGAEKDGKMKQSFLSKIGKMIKGFLAKVGQLFDRFLLWVQTTTKSFVTKVLAGSSTKLDDYAKAANDATTDEKIAYLNSCKFIPKATAAEMFNITNGGKFIKDLGKEVDLEDLKTAKAVGKIARTMQGSGEARWAAAKEKIGSSAVDMVRNGYKNYAKNILKERKEMDKELKKAYNEIARKGDLTEEDVKKIDNFPRALKHNSMVVHAYISDWSAFTTSCLKWIQLGKKVLHREKSATKYGVKSMASMGDEDKEKTFKTMMAGNL